MNRYELQIFAKQADACDFQADHLCHACWDRLINRPESGGWIVECIRCGENTKAYVTRKYAERRWEKSNELSRAAKEAMTPYVKWLQGPKRTEADNLKALGF